MSWQLACFGLLGAVLAGGIVWYERSRPPAKVVAMVASLAALAVAGRVLFAPIPNVLATTDIVLLSGYAIGAAPGYAVGALAALVSNFWLGQGPWTPWQMAAWGLVGVGGAALARISARRLGRFGLAAACGVAGLAYGALLDLSTMVSYGGEQSLERYLALSTRGIPFNVAHAAGNAAFALVAGPALVRMLLRFRARLEVSWREAPVPPGEIDRGRPRAARAAATILVLGACAGGAAAFAATSPAPAATAGKGQATAVRWLVGAQSRDGGFPSSPGGKSSVAMTGWTMLGLEAAGRNPLDVRGAGRTPVDYLRAHAKELRSTGDLERTILALEGAGLEATRFAGRDLAAELRGRRREDGSFERQVGLTSFGVLALEAGGTSPATLSRSARWLIGAQNRDGGWGSVESAPSEADSTGAALQALAAAGIDKAAMSDGVSYLRRSQRRDGGWPLAHGGPVNSMSTAWAVQGLIAAGADPARLHPGGRDPYDYLTARQAADGHYRYSASSDQTPVWATAQTLLALNGAPLPLEPAPRSPAEPTSRHSDVTASDSNGGDESRNRGQGKSSDLKKKSRASNQPGDDRAHTVRKQRDFPVDDRSSAPKSDSEPGEANLAPYAAVAIGIAGLFALLWYRRGRG